MALEVLRFCRKCLATPPASMGEVCEQCGGEMAALLDEQGAISRDYLVARGTCCGNGCRNCPYGDGDSSEAKDRVCPKCGAGFKCSVDAGCWCKNVPLSVETLDMLREKYEGCLCPACLEKFSRD